MQSALMLRPSNRDVVADHVVGEAFVEALAACGDDAGHGVRSPRFDVGAFGHHAVASMYTNVFSRLEDFYPMR